MKAIRLPIAVVDKSHHFYGHIASSVRVCILRTVNAIVVTIEEDARDETPYDWRITAALPCPIDGIFVTMAITGFRDAESCS